MDSNFNYFKDQNNYKKSNLSDEKIHNCEKEDNENVTPNSMLSTMNDLITTMQQLQKMFIQQISQKNEQTDNKNTLILKEINMVKVKPSQTEIMLQQVQNAMESTIAQLSSRFRTGPDISEHKIVNQKMADEDRDLSTSEKWRLYTEMYQSKNESSQDYCINKMKLGQELGLSFKETKREMLIGLWNNRLSTILYLKQHETEEELLKDIEDWEKIDNARNEVFKKYRNKTYKTN